MKGKTFKYTTLIIFVILLGYLLFYHQKKSYEEYIQLYVDDKINTLKMVDSILFLGNFKTDYKIMRMENKLMHIQYKIRHFETEMFEMRKIPIEDAFDNRG